MSIIHGAACAASPAACPKPPHWQALRDLLSTCCSMTLRHQMGMTQVIMWPAQVTGPIYKLVATNLGGEKRFAAAVARRLQSLGALTRGDRRAASGIDLSESNFDSPLGRKSLRRMYDCIIQCSPLLPSGVTLAEVLEGSSANDVKDIVASLPDSGTISAAAMITAGDCVSV